MAKFSELKGIHESYPTAVVKHLKFIRKKAVGSFLIFKFRKNKEMIKINIIKNNKKQKSFKKYIYIK